MAQVAGLYYKMGLNYDSSNAERMKRDIISIDRMVKSLGQGQSNQKIIDSKNIIGDLSAVRAGASNIRSLNNALKRFDSRDNSNTLGKIRREASAVGNLSSAYRDASKNVARFVTMHSRLFSGGNSSTAGNMVNMMRRLNRETEHSTRRNAQNITRLGVGTRSLTRSLTFMRSTLGALGVPLAVLGGGGLALGALVKSTIDRADTVRKTQNQSALLGVTPQQQRSTDYQFKAMGADDGAGVVALRNIREFQAQRSRGQIDENLASMFAIAGMPSFASMVKPGQNPIDALDNFRNVGHRAYSNAGNNETQKQNVINALSPIFGESTQAVISRPDSEWQRARNEANKNAPMGSDQERAQRKLTEATTHLEEAFDKLQGQILVKFGPWLANLIDGTADLLDDKKRDKIEEKGKKFEEGLILLAMLRDGEKKPYSDSELQKARESGNNESVAYYERNKRLNDMFDSAQKSHPELVGNSSSFSASMGSWFTKDRYSNNPEEHEKWLKTPGGQKYLEYEADVKKQEQSNAARDKMHDEYLQASKDESGGKMDEWRAKWLGATSPKRIDSVDTGNPSDHRYSPAAIPVTSNMSREDMHRASIYKESRGSDVWTYDDPKGKFKKGDWMVSDSGAMYSRQVLPSVAHDKSIKKRLGVDPVRDDSPEESNRFGDDLLDALYNKYNHDAQKAMAAYHSGEGNVDRAVRIAEKNGLDWRGGLGVNGRGYIDYDGQAWKPSDYEPNRRSGVDQSAYAPAQDSGAQRQTTMTAPTMHLNFNGVSGRDADMIEQRIRTVLDEYTAQQNMNTGANFGAGIA